MSGSSGREGREIPTRPGYGSGCFRRRIVVESSKGWARGELADDFHHFAAEVEHADGVVREIRGEDIRVPWTTCPGALVPLRAMIGAPLSRDVRALHRFTKASAQCTHLHDAACLAIAQAARAGEGGATHRRYDATLPDRVAGRTEATVDRDEDRVFSWTIEGQRIRRCSAGRFDDRPLSGRGFHEAVGALGDPDLVEAAWVLQRTVFIGTGRRHDFEGMQRAVEFASVIGGACHTFSNEHIGDARKIPGTVLDFTDRPEAILDRER